MAFGERLREFATRNPRSSGALAGATAFGGGQAALLGVSGKERNERRAKEQAKEWGYHPGSSEYNSAIKNYKKDKVISAAMAGGILGGLTGHNVAEIHNAKERFKQQYRYQHHHGGQQYKQAPSHYDVKAAWDTLGLHGKEKTKAEVKKTFLDLVKKHHPDKGGSTAKMQEVNSAMDKLKDSDWFTKLSFWQGFTKQAGAAEFTPDSREKTLEPNKKKFEDQLPADGWSGPILDGRMVD